MFSKKFCISFCISVTSPVLVLMISDFKQYVQKQLKILCLMFEYLFFDCEWHPDTRKERKNISH